MNIRALMYRFSLMAIICLCLVVDASVVLAQNTATDPVSGSLWASVWPSSVPSGGTIYLWGGMDASNGYTGSNYWSYGNGYWVGAGSGGSVDSHSWSAGSPGTSYFWLCTNSGYCAYAGSVTVTAAAVDCGASWSSCSGGSQTYTIGTYPSGGGTACETYNGATQSCGTNGGWSDYSPTCSSSCGYGGEWQYRSCTSPSPSGGGAGCSGGTTNWCNATAGCPVNCSAGWSTCSGGSTTYTIYTYPANGGSACSNTNGASQGCGTAASLTGWSACSGGSQSATCTEASGGGAPTCAGLGYSAGSNSRSCGTPASLSSWSACSGGSQSATCTEASGGGAPTCAGLGYSAGSNSRGCGTPASCGSASGSNYYSAPSTNQCSSGSPSASPAWSWTCISANGGTSSGNCSANQKVDGACGFANGSNYYSAPSTNQCNSGSASASPAWSWTCSGSNGGTPSGTCSANQKVDGACGFANGSNYYSAPSTNQCNSGSASASPAWSWTCSGSNGGTPSGTCSANQSINGVCSSTHYGCTTPGSSINNALNTNTYNWNCSGSYSGTTATCVENIPTPSNFSASCSSSGNTASFSWTLPSGYTLSYFRVTDNTTATNPSVWIPDNFADSGPATSFSSIQGHNYTAWVHTRLPGNQYSSAVYATAFTCPALPSVTASAAAGVAPTSATLNANVTSLGTPASISARGTCWATTATPRVNCLVEGGLTTGAYSRALTGLNPNSTYYYAGYVTNSAGTAYSGDISFLTPQISQTIAAFTTPGSATYRGTFAVTTPVATSGLGVSMTAGGGCTISAGTVTMTSGTTACTITASQGGNSSYTAAPSVTNTINASPASLTATASAVPSSKVYGSFNPTLGVSITGGVNGDTFSSSASTAATASSPVGSYTVSPTTVTGTNVSNYTVNYVNATLTVTPLALTFTGSRVYDGTATANAGILTMTNVVGSDGPSLTSSGSVTLAGSSAPSQSISSFTGLTLSGVASSNYTLSGASGTITITPASQTISFTQLGGKTYGNIPFGVSATGGASGVAVTFSSLTAGVCTMVGSTVTIVAQGTCTVRASQGGTSNYNAAANVDNTFTVSKATLTVTADGKGKAYDTTLFSAFTSTISGYVNGDLASVVTGAPAYSGTATGNAGVGSWTITPTVNTLAASNYVFSYANGTLTITPASQTISFGSLVTRTYGDLPFGVSATGGASGVAVTFSSLTAGVCTVAGSTVTIAAAGTCTIQASQGGSANYNAAASVNQSFSVALANQTISFGALGAKTYGNAAFSVSATGGASGVAVTFSSLTAGVCTVAGSTVTIAAAGTCTIQASQGGSANYNAAASVNQSFSVALASQTISFGALGAKTYGNAAFLVSATGGASGVAVTFSSLTAGVCTMVGSTVTIVAQGTCTVRASQGGTSNYNAAANVDNTFTVSKATLTVTADGKGKVYDTTLFSAFTSTISGYVNGDLASVVTGAPAYSGTATTNAGVGSWTITPTVNTLAASNYVFSYANGTLTITPASQTISFGALGAKTYGDAAFLVSATGGASGVAVTFSSLTAGVCTVAGSTVTIAAAGTCTIQASQGASANYNAAASVNQSFSVALANQTISFGALGAKTYGNAAFLVSATGGASGVAVTFSSLTAGVCTMVGSTVTIVAQGTCTIRASQGGTSNYNAAANVDNTFTVSKATLTVTADGKGKVYDTTLFSAFTSTISGYVNGDLASVVTGAPAYSGTATTNAGVGSWTITPTVNTLAASNYVFSYANGTLTITPASQTISFGALGAKTYGNAAFSVSATGGASGVAVTFSSLTAGVCTVAGSTVTIAAAGTCTIQASQGGSANYNAAASVNQSFSVALANQTISFGALGAKTYGNAAFSVSATGGASGVAVTFSSLTAGVCTMVGSTVTIVAQGTCTVRASQGGTSNYNAAANVDNTFTVSKATLTVTADGKGKAYDTALFSPFTSTISGYVNGDTSAVVTGTPAYSGTATGNAGVGSWTITPTVNTLAASNYVFSYANGTLTITPASQTISFGSLVTRTYGDLPFGVSATGGASGVAVTFSSLTAGVCTVAGSTVTIAAAGTCTIQASQGGSANYNAAASVNQSFSVALANQTISFGALGAKTYGNAAFSVSATGGASGVAVTFSSLTAGVCTVAGSTVTIAAAGTCTIQASQGGSANYNAAASVNQSFSVALASQTISFGALGAKTYGNAAFLVSATGGASGVAVTFSSLTAGVCTMVGSTVTIVAQGTCTVRASQGGTSNYNAAANVDNTFTVSKATLTVTADGKGKVYDTTLFSAFTSTISGYVNGDLASVVTGAPAYSGTATTNAGVGSWTITPTVNTLAASNYVFSYANGTLTITPASQTISFGALGAKTYGNAAFSVSATGGASGVAVTFSSLTAGVCTVAGSTVTIAAAGTCTIQASQGGSANYNAAASVNQSFSVALASQTISFGALGAKTYGNAAFLVSATGGASGVAVTFSSLTAGVCTMVGSTVTIVAQGTCTVRASQGGTSNYNAAANVDNTFTVSKATLTVTADGKGKVYDTTLFSAFTSTISGYVNGDLASVVTGAPAYSGTATTNAGVGSWTITPTVNTLAASNYVFSYANGTLTITPASQTISFGALGAKTYGDAAFLVSATGGASGVAVTFSSLTAGVCTVAGSTVTIAAAGTCTIQASQGASANYNAAASVNQSFSVALANQTISFGALGAKTYGNAAFSVSATGGASGVAVTFSSLTAGVCTMVGSTVTIVAQGTCTVRASQGGTSNYNAAANVDNTFTVSKATLTVTADGKGKVYDTTLFSAFTSTISGYVNGDLASVVTGAPAYSGTATTNAGVGSWTITPTVNTLAASNYVFSYANGTLTITPASQTISFGALGAKTYGNAAFSVSATGGASGVAVTFSSLTAGVCTVAGSTVTIAAAGTCTIQASQGASANYNAAASVNQSFSVALASQTISFGALGAKTYGNAAFLVSATGGASGVAVTFSSLTAGVCTMVGSTVTIVAQGTCTVRASQGGTSNYNAAANVDNTFTVSKATLTVTADGKGKVYDTTLFSAFTSTISGYVNGDLASVVTGAPAYSGTATTNAGVGSWTITPTVNTLAASNYVFSYANGTLTITPASQTISFGALGAKTYGDAAFSVSATGGASGVAVTFSSLTAGVCTVAGSTVTIAAAGTCTIQASQGGSANYNAAASVNQSFSVALASQTISFGALGAKTYGNAAFLVSATGGASGVAVTFSSLTAGVCTMVGSTVTIVAQGTCTVRASQGGTSNYNAAANVDNTFTVSKATLTVTANGKAKTYGAANPALDANYSGFVNGETTAVLSGSPSITTTAGTGSATGSYTITSAVGTLSAANYSFSFVNGTLTISPASLTVTANAQSKTYGSTLALGTSAFTTGGLTNGDTVTSATLSSGGAAAGSAVTTYSITPSAAVGTGLGNYTITYNNGTLTVNKATLTVTANGKAKTYGAANPALDANYSGFVNGETTAVLSGSPSITTTAGTGSATGSYTITSAVGTLSAANYSFSFVNGTLTISPASLTVTANAQSKTYGSTLALGTSAFTTGGLTNGDTVTSATLSSGGAAAGSAVTTYSITPSAAVGTGLGNYTITYNNGTLTVNKATLTVTANGKAKTYGAANPALDANYSGFVNGETTAVLSGSPSITTTAGTGSATGSYTITSAVGTLSAANYSFSFVNGTLTISPASLTVTANAQSKTYGSTLALGTSAFTTGGLTNGDTVTSATLSSGGAAAGSAVTTYSITPSAAVGTGLGNYTITYNNGTLTVNKATLTVTANGKAKTYGAANPALDANYSGFVNGETTAVLSGSPSITTTAGTGSATGSYTITSAVGTLSAANYSFSFVNGTLTISPASLTVTANAQSKTYGSTLALGTSAFTTGGLTNGDTVTSATLSSGGAAAGSAVTTYSITPSAAVGTGLGNYTITYNNGTLTVNKATLTVNINSKIKTYNTVNPTFDLATTPYTGFLNGDTSAVVSGSPSLTTTAVTGSPVGAYLISGTVGTLASTNYSFTIPNGTLSVIKANSSLVSWVPASLVYGQAVRDTNQVIQSPQLNATANVPGTFAYTPIDGSVLPAGNQTLSATFTPTDTTNYNGFSTTVNLFIDKDWPPITWPTPSAIAYGTPLSATQLNATAPAWAPGTFVYSPVSGTVLSVGTQSLSSTYSANDPANHNTNIVTTVNLTINPAPQTITFGALAGKTYGNAPFVVSASASSNLTVAFTSSPSTVCTNVGTTVTIVGGGTCTVTAAQAGNASYNPATSVNQSFTVSKVTLTVTADSKGKLYDGAVFSPFTSIIVGYTNGDTSAIISGGPTYSGTAVGAINYNATPYVITPAITLTAVAALNYNVVYVNGTLAISQATPIVTWSNPTAITYGTALSGTQLNATFSVPGNCVYTPASAAVLLVSASQTLSATCTPTDLVNYIAVPKTVTLAVNKASLTATAWVSPTSKVYGAALPSFGVTFSGAVNGDTFSSSPTTVAAASSPVGNYAVSATTVGGTNVANYNVTYVDGTLTVTKASLTATAWVSPTSKVYGAALPSFGVTFSGAVNGDTFSSSPTTVAAASSPVGNYAVSATTVGGTNVANYNVTYVSGTLAITPVTLTVNINSKIKTYNVANPAFDLASPAYTGFVNGDTSAVVSGVPNYSSSAVTGSAIGTYTISGTVGAPGNLSATNYIFNIPNSTLSVIPGITTVTWNNPAAITFGTTLSATQLSATANVAGNFTYWPTFGMLLNGGTQTLSVSFTPTDSNYASVSNQTVSILVNKDSPAITWPTPSAITYGTALSGTQLNASSAVPGTFVYTPASGTVMNAGVNQTLSVTYTPSDTVNHNNVTQTVNLTLNKATPIITWATPAAIAYGTALSATQLNATVSYLGSGIAGTIVYTPASGAVPALATQTLSAAFTPSAPANYNSASGNVTQSVVPAQAVITPVTGACGLPKTSVSWPVAALSTSYKLHHSTSGTSGTFSQLPVGAPANAISPFADTQSLVSGVTYFYQLEAVNASGSSFSNIGSAVASDPCPAVKVNVTTDGNYFGASGKTRVPFGGSTLIKWTSENATTCTSPDFATGGATSNTTGVSTGPITTIKSYNVNCSQ